MIIKNMPDANELWKGIGGYFDSIGEILCEFIDNSISNFRCHNSQMRTILVKFQECKNCIEVSVEDTGTGINNLNAAFTLGSHDGAETLLNEHGFGFKHALASANPENNNWSIITCTEQNRLKNNYVKIAAPYKLEEFSADEIQGQWPGAGKTGTIVRFSCSKEMYWTIRRGLKGAYSRFESGLELLREDLGYIYAGVLKENAVQISIVQIKEGEIVNSSVVTPVEPSWEFYYDPKSGIEKVDLGNGKVSIEYTFGAIIDNDRYKRHYRRMQTSSGVEIRINGRILSSNIISPIWGVAAHPKFNQFLATINLVSDNADRLPKTKTSKNGLREGDPQLQALFEWILKKKPSLPTNTDNAPEDVEERDLFKDLAEAKRIHIKNATIETEMYAFKSLEEKIRIDLFLSKDGEVEIFEGKKDKTTVKDLYQLLMYWDGCVYDGIQPTKGILISAHHPDSVKQIVNVINSMKDANDSSYNIVLESWRDEGIQYPM